MDVFIPRPSAEESEATHRRWSGGIIDTYYPVLAGYLTSQEIDKKAHACKTIKDVEQLRINQVPDDMFEKLIELVNGITDANDSERLFILIQCADRLIFAATQYTNNILHQRVQAIGAEPKSRIIV